jgi:hypothetical protein
MSPSVAPEQATAPRQSAPTTPLGGLQPPLKSALSSLNVHLDYELARYRYAKQGGPQPGAPHQLQLKSSRSAPALINMPGRSRPVAPPPPVPPNPRLQPTQADLGAPGQGPAAEVAALRSALVHQAQAPTTAYWDSSEALLESLGQDYPHPQTEAPAPSEAAWFKHLNTPLGLGAFLLLLVASAGFGFVLVNPAAVKHLVNQTPLAHLWTDNNDAAENTASTPETASDAPTTGEAALDPLSPNLAEKEFAHLDLRSLSTLPSAAVQPMPPTATKPTDRTPNTATTEATDPTNSTPEEATAAQASTIPQQTVRSPREVTVQPMPVAPRAAAPVPNSAPARPAAPSTAAQPAPPAASSAAASGSDTASSSTPTSYYYVVANYTGDPSLDTARSVVPDAYVRNFEIGARIQLGAFNSEAAADDLLAELASQGISAEVYQP